jgi:hypothetical protein
MRFGLALSAGVLAITGVSSVATAQTSIEACSSAYTKGQEDRLAGRLFDARQAFIACAELSCPEAIRADCSRWQSEVEQDLPTIRLKVADIHGAAVNEVKLSADGTSVPAAKLARPIILESGPHTLRVEANGFSPVELERALRPTDRELEVSVVLHRLDEPAAPKKLDAVVASDVRPFPTAAVVVAGVGLAALGGSLYFGLRSHRQYEALKDSCAPACEPSRSDSLRTNALISDVALAGSVVLLGTAAWLYFRATPTQPSATALSVAPNLHGAGLRLRVAF